MILAMHQPNFLPWLGFFHKMAQADVLILLDDVQVPQGRSWATRSHIKTPGGARWLSLPVHRHGNPSYSDAHVAKDGGLSKMWGVIYHNYTRAPYYDLYAKDLQPILANAVGRSLADVNGALINWSTSRLGIDTPIMCQSELHIEANDGSRLAIALCQAVGADIYLSGQGAKSYNQLELFEAAGIELRYQDFRHPTYPQLWGNFVPEMAVIDLLFNCGPNAYEVLLSDD